MKKVIWFDMDGTIADLYGVEGWLDMLRAENPTPYMEAKVLLNMQALARVLNNARKRGYAVGVISWLSRGGSAEYGAKVAQAKREWLAKHLASVQFDYIDIVEYGTPKHEGREGILFDDEEPNRIAWGEGAHDVQDIIKIIRGL